MTVQMMTSTREPAQAAGRPAVEIEHLRKTYGSVVAATSPWRAVTIHDLLYVPGLFAPGRGQLHHLSPTSRALYAAMTS